MNREADAGSWRADVAPLVVAASAAAGCWIARPDAVAAGGAVAGLLAALVGGRRLLPSALAAVLVAVLASVVSAHAWAGLEPPRAQRFDGEVTLVTDPEVVPGGLRMTVRGSGRHSILSVPTASAGPLRGAMAGERVHIAGWLVPVRDDAWLARRHIATRLTAETVGTVREGHPVTRLANGIRRVVDDGAGLLGERDRSLYLGLVLGDDRDQTRATIDDFRAAGLTHLLVVSGQNVAFVLAVASPLLDRLQLRSRLVATLAVVAFFALVTRFEPSVLRATTMVGITACTVTLGRPTSRLRVLAYAATLCLLMDPFLVQSVGFGLSVSACVGIVVLAPTLSAHLRGPGFVREPLALTLAAQIGVAPLLIGTFDGVPVASIPANLLAGAASGFVMCWGMSVGLVAGSLPSELGSLAMAPAGAAVAWIAAVASWASGLPLGHVDDRSGLALAILAAGLIVVRRRRRSWGTRRASRPGGDDV